MDAKKMNLKIVLWRVLPGFPGSHFSSGDPRGTKIVVPDLVRSWEGECGRCWRTSVVNLVVPRTWGTKKNSVQQVV